MAASTSSCRLTDSDMRRISALVYEKSGIALRDTKRGLVIARLQKRLRQGGFASYADYLAYLESDRSGAELTLLLDAITTNHTEFFREVDHFHFLADCVLPALVAKPGARPIVGWSAACATGEEAYSIAVTLLGRLPHVQQSRVRLLASDLSARALHTARAGIYPIERVDQLPRGMLRRYFERGVGEQEGVVRVKRQVRSLIDFRRLNLITIADLGVRFDFIFCRNAMIYFDRQSRQRVVAMLERHLAADGYLFVAHSESLSEIDHRLRRCAAGVYRRSTT